MKKLVVLVMVMLAPLAASANEQVAIHVNGLVCDFCAQSLNKLFLKRDEVAKVDVNLDDSRVTIGMKKGATIDDATLNRIITDSGYNLVLIERSEVNEK